MPPLEIETANQRVQRHVPMSGTRIQRMQSDGTLTLQVRTIISKLPPENRQRPDTIADTSRNIRAHTSTTQQDRSSGCKLCVIPIFSLSSLDLSI